MYSEPAGERDVGRPWSDGGCRPGGGLKAAGGPPWSESWGRARRRLGCLHGMFVALHTRGARSKKALTLCSKPGTVLFSCGASIMSQNVPNHAPKLFLLRHQTNVMFDFPSVHLPFNHKGPLMQQSPGLIELLPYMAKSHAAVFLRLLLGQVFNSFKAKLKRHVVVCSHILADP